MTFKLESEHFYGFAFKIFYSWPDFDERGGFWSVSGDRFLEVEKYIPLIRFRDGGQMVDYFEARFPVIVYCRDACGMVKAKFVSDEERYVNDLVGGDRDVYP